MRTFSQVHLSYPPLRVDKPIYRRPNTSSISTILKALQEGLESRSNEQPLNGHSFRVGAALDLLEQGEPLEKIMLRGGWQTDSAAMKYLRNWVI